MSPKISPLLSIYSAAAFINCFSIFHHTILTVAQLLPISRNSNKMESTPKVQPLSTQPSIEETVVNQPSQRNSMSENQYSLLRGEATLLMKM